MTYYDEFYVKLKEIKFICEIQPNCDNCPFAMGRMFKYCRIGGAPYEWNFKDKGANQYDN